EVNVFLFQPSFQFGDLGVGGRVVEGGGEDGAQLLQQGHVPAVEVGVAACGGGPDSDDFVAGDERGVDGGAGARGGEVAVLGERVPGALAQRAFESRLPVP